MGATGEGLERYSPREIANALNLAMRSSPPEFPAPCQMFATGGVVVFLCVSWNLRIFRAVSVISPMTRERGDPAWAR